jgi:Divergent InlB B-repeat domain
MALSREVVRRRMPGSRRGSGAVALLLATALLASGCSAAVAEGATLSDEIFRNGFEQFTLAINDYFGQCSVSVNGGASTSTPQPMLFAEGQVVSLHADANAGFVWRYWSGADGGEPDPNQDTTVAMVADRQVLACCQTADQMTCGPTLTVTKAGSGDGTVTSDVAGIDCGDDCNENYPVNSQVVLSAVAAPGSTFAGWSGGGCSGTGTCPLTIDSIVTVVATFNVVPPNYVFVTSSTYVPGNLGGLAGADFACQSRAASAGLAGTYRAWLSSTTVNAKDRLAGARGWTRRGGAAVADQVSDIVSGHLFYPISYDENGAFVGAVPVATATNSLGDVSGGTCSDWTVTSNATGSGIASNDGSGFTQWGTVSCGAPAHLYCFGTDNAAVVAPPAPPAGNVRLAFLSTGWFPGGGLAAADAQCATDATAAGLSGTFKALLATAATPALSRFNTAGLPWARPDNTKLASTAAALSAATYVDATPTSNADNTLWYSNFGVWSGASSLTTYGSLTDTCNDWTSGVGTGVYGISDATKVADWRARGTISCNQPNAIVCLQQ